MRNELRLWLKKAGSIMAMLIDLCGLKNTKINVCFFVLCLFHIIEDFKFKTNFSILHLLDASLRKLCILVLSATTGILIDAFN